MNDPNIIDITGRDHRIDQLKFPDDPPLVNQSNIQIDYSTYWNGPESSGMAFRQ